MERLEAMARSFLAVAVPVCEELFGELISRLAPLSDREILVGAAALITAFYLAGSVAVGALSSPAKATRRRAWVVTFLSSVVMSSCGAYFAHRLWLTDGAMLYPSFTGEGHDVDVLLARSVSLFFFVYCALDMLLALLFYHEEVGVGYAHHSLYMVLLAYLWSTDQSIIFAICAVEEIPTLFLSIYELRGDTRPRLTTGLTIFAFRISYHLFVTYKAIEFLSPTLYFVSAYLLLHHIAWFRSWFFRRVQARRDQDQALSEDTEPGKDAVRTKKLKLEVTAHVHLVTVLFVAQTLMHLTLVVIELKTSLMPKADWTERNWALARIVMVMLGHIVCFFSVATRMAGILHDVYEQHFIMHTIEQRTIIYNISWEDPRVERELLDIGPSDVILTISSAGCNVLDYLIEGPKAIVACDFNVAQLAVLALKLECIRNLEYEEYFKIWAESDFEVFEANYESVLRPGLDPEYQSFWDENKHLIRENFMFAGTSGLAAKLLIPALRFLGVTDYMVKRKMYPPANIGLALVRSFLQLQWVWAVLAPLGGVPKSQLDLVKREPEVWSERLEEVLGRRMWLPDNYFYYAYIAGRWSKECCPRYMEEQHFAALQKNVDRVQLHHGPIAQAAKLRKDFTVASLLDSMDWMPDSMIADQLSALIPQMAPGPKGNIFWRSFATKVHSPVLASLLPDLVPDEDGSERVGWYLTQWVAEVPKKVDYSLMITEDHASQYHNTLMDDVMVMTAMGFHAMRSTKDVRAFYKSQGKNYDGFREALLPDRDTLLKYCLPWHTRPKTWLSVGCGTARDIEYVVANIQTTGVQVFLLDLSPTLLEMARERVQRLGLGDQVIFVEADICKAYKKQGVVDASAIKAYDVEGNSVDAAKAMPRLGQFDMVTCSYCMTMIPPWREALQAMINALTKGGTLAFIDFTRRSDRPDHWSQRLNTWWFAHDGVYFDHEHTRSLREHPQLTTTWFSESEARVPYTLLQATHYIWTGRKTA